MSSATSTRSGKSLAHLVIVTPHGKIFVNTIEAIPAVLAAFRGQVDESPARIPQCFRMYSEPESPRSSTSCDFSSGAGAAHVSVTSSSQTSDGKSISVDSGVQTCLDHAHAHTQTISGDADYSHVGVQVDVDPVVDLQTKGPLEAPSCSEAFSQTDDVKNVKEAAMQKVASCLHDSGTQTDVQSSLTVEASTQSVDTVEYITGLENDLNLLTSKTSQMLIAYEQLVIKYEALYGQKVAIASDAVGGDCVDAQDVDAMADDSSSRISSWADASDNPEESVPVAADTVVTGWKRKNGRKKK
eukprot:TRINITY_DN21854_c0_g2_i2.p1 TRINITY_DN21854_c0_g2~~TRINITY_DN21854_c0_g2_i2.p1  ORF type:complete len:299 (-),score=42.29 TRINITY_DN21854_c0_g2_i2:168-1064(-)